MSDAANFPAHYFNGLMGLFQKVEVTDATGLACSFAAGLGRAAELVRQRCTDGGRLYFIGNGGSAAVASHQAIDYWRNGGFPAVCFNDGALLTCIGNDFGYDQVFRKPLEMFARPGDILIAISSSGKSANIVEGARCATELGCHVITLSAFGPDNPLRYLGELNFYVPTRAYGYAEIAHLGISHCLLDGLASGALAGGGTTIEKTVASSAEGAPAAQAAAAPHPSGEKLIKHGREFQVSPDPPSPRLPAPSPAERSGQTGK